MKRKLLGSLAGAALVALLATPALHAAGFLTNGLPPAGGSQFPTTVPLTGNETLPADTNLAGGISPQSESISVSQLSAAMLAGAGPRNYLSNGAMAINQQGTGTITGGTTSITALQFAADRWFIDTNVGSGAGQAAVITASPAPPTGFQQSVKFWRNSGALTQQICLLQEIETSRATQLAGKSVVFSMYAQPLAGLTSSAGNVQAYIITGTGTDQGLGTLTASPAITPAWTGIAGGTTPAQTWALGTTAAWGRYYTPAVTIPAAATEVGVEICFTPVGSSSGATDGVAITGTQLEPVQIASTSAPAAPSLFEFRQVQDDLRDAERFFWQLNEPAASTPVAWCQITVANTTAVCGLELPQTMRGTTPVFTAGTTGTFKLVNAVTATTWTSPVTVACNIYYCGISAGGTGTVAVNLIETLQGGGGSGILTVSNDKIM